MAIGDNNYKKNLLNKLELYNANIPILIHPKSVLGSKVNIGKRTIVMAGVIINTNTIIEKGCI